MKYLIAFLLSTTAFGGSVQDIKKIGDKIVGQAKGGEQVSFTDRVHARAAADSTSQSLTDGVALQIQFNDVVDDTNGAVTTGAGWEFTAPKSGLYQISVSVGFAVGSSNAGILQVEVLVNGGAVNSDIYVVGRNKQDIGVSVPQRGGSITRRLQKGDEITVSGTQTGGSTGWSVYTGGGREIYTYISITKIGT